MISRQAIERSTVNYLDVVFQIPKVTAVPTVDQIDENQAIADSQLTASFINVDPITCIAVQHVGGCINVIGEFALRNSDIYQLCDSIIAKYPKASLIVTGDATGANRSALTAGNTGYYDVVQSRLRLGRMQMRQPVVNPSVRDTRVLVNSLLQNYCVKIDRSCKGLITDLKYVEVDEEGDIMYHGTNVRVIAVPGLTGTNRIVSSYLGNFFYGTDLLSDEEQFSIWFSKDNDEVRFQAAFKAGVQIAYPDLVVDFRLT